MKIAYLILAHRDWNHLSKLVVQLKNESSDVFIHIDKKSSFKEDQLSEECRDLNYTLLQPRIKVFWGDVSIVDATLIGLEAIHESAESYDRVVLLSGQDFPIVPKGQIMNFFSENQDKEFLEFGQLPCRWWPYGGLDRVQVYNFPSLLGSNLNKVIRVLQMSLPFRRNKPHEIRFFGCSQWFNITGVALDHIVERVKATDIRKRFRFSFCADELFFQTILLNSPLAGQCVNNNLRFQIWDPGSSSPRVLGAVEHADVFAARDDQLFARKFDSEKSRCLLNQIAEKLSVFSAPNHTNL